MKVTPFLFGMALLMSAVGVDERVHASDVPAGDPPLEQHASHSGSPSSTLVEQVREVLTAAEAADIEAVAAQIIPSGDTPGAREAGVAYFIDRALATCLSQLASDFFVCDGSSLVTSGRGQPTMTIQALAFRAGEHIARFAKRGEI